MLRAIFKGFFEGYVFVKVLRGDFDSHPRPRRKKTKKRYW